MLNSAPPHTLVWKCLQGEPSSGQQDRQTLVCKPVSPLSGHGGCMWRVCMVAFALVIFHAVAAQRTVCSTIRASQENAQIHVFPSLTGILGMGYPGEGRRKGLGGAKAAPRGQGCPAWLSPCHCWAPRTMAAEGSCVLTRGYL